MRVYDIALFIFIFQISLGIVKNIGITSAGLSGVGISGQSAEAYALQQTSQVKGLSEQGQSEGINLQAIFSWFNAAFKFVVNGIPMVINFIWDMFAGIYVILTALQAPVWFALSMQALVYLIYTVGLLQYVIGRSFREYE
jgi:hypothetical protein